MPKRDCYEVLGVHRNASEAEIKKAYRKLALECHPDRHPGDAGAEARFKEAAEAYAILADPAKRAHFDQFGHPPEGSGGGYGPQGFDFRSNVDDLFGEIFGDIFGQRRGARGPRPERGSDLRYNLSIAFEEAVFGCTREIEIPVRRACGTCAGSGAKPGTEPTACPDCRGHGRVRVQQGFFQLERDCTRCAGSGRVALDPCSDCRGQGAVRARRHLSVRVPPGVETGTRLRVTGEGEGGAHGGPPGDLYVVLSVTEHPFFLREGIDVLCTVPIAMTQAALGAEIEVPTLEGETAKAQVPPGTQHGTVLALKGRGAPRGGSGRRGDLKIVIQVEVPTRLSARQAELLREFEALREEEPESAVGRFWDKVRRLFA